MSAVAGEPSEFGRLVLRWREQRNLSQDALAEMAGYTGGYISQIETGKRGKRPSRDVVVRLAQILGAPLPQMLAAAGRLEPGDEMTPAGRMSFADFVATDPALTNDQKATLVSVYRSLVGRADQRPPVTTPAERDARIAPPSRRPPEGSGRRAAG